MSRTNVIAEGQKLAMGLDVDYQTSAVVVLHTATGEVLYEGRLPHQQARWQRFLTRFPGCELWACYETGGIGFHLCRMLRSLGVNCQVVPVSKIPKTPESRQQKNDRRDAMSLAQLYFHPPKTFVRIPTEAEEADRQLIRTRDQMIKNHTRCMQRIKALLVYHQISRPPGIRANWGKAFRQWLHSNPGSSVELNRCLTVYLEELEQLERLIESLTASITALSTTDRYRPACDRLCNQLDGVGRLTAMAFLLEVFRPHEFGSAEAIASHLGLTPCEYSSGKRHRYGHITHWGPPHLRKLLVEASWAWVRKDQDAYRRYQQIRASSKRKIAIVAMARRLAIVMWAMTVKEQNYHYRWAA
jgi:transposase